jgi:Glycosyltransferase family 87
MTHESTAAENARQAVRTTAEQRVSCERDGCLIVSGALRPDEAADAGYAVDRVYRTAPLLLVALPLVFLGYGLAGWSRGWALGVDSSVYRAGAMLLLHGHSPYDVSGLGYLHLSFTYPPAAALLFTPLAVLPAQLAWAVMASASALALALVIRVAIAAVPYWRFPATWSTLLLTVAMLGLVPVWRTIGLGQVNILLMAMAAVDVLAVTASQCPPRVHRYVRHARQTPLPADAALPRSEVRRVAS